MKYRYLMRLMLFFLSVVTTIEARRTHKKKRQQHVIELIDMEHFKNVKKKALEEEKFVVLEITTAECPACEVMNGVFHQAARQHKQNMLFLHAADENPKLQTLVDKYVTQYPTIVFFKQGKKPFAKAVVYRSVGSFDKAVEQFLKEESKKPEHKKEVSVKKDGSAQSSKTEDKKMGDKKTEEKKEIRGKTEVKKELNKKNNQQKEASNKQKAESKKIVKQQAEIVHIITNQKTFDKFIEQGKRENKKVIIKLFTNWCSFCKLYAPIFEKVAEKNDKNFIFAAANLEKEELSFLKQYSKGYPTTLIFEPKKSQPISRPGLLGEDVLEKWINL